MSAQPPGSPSLWDLLQARLGQHVRDVYAPMLGGGQPLPHRLGHAFEAGTHLGELGLIKDAAEHVVGDVVGSMYAASSGQSADPRDQRIADAYRTGGPAASLAAARTDPRKEVSLTAGALTELLNPVNYVGAGVLPKLGRVGEIADVIGRAPFAPAEYALGQLGRRAVAPAIQRAREALYGATEGVTGNVPRSAGLLGPVPPPPLRTPPPLVPGPTSILDLARGGVPPAEVARIAPLPEALAPTRAPNLVREVLAGAPTPALHGPALPPARALAPEQLREALGNLMARRTASPPPEAVTLAEERALRPQPAPPAGVESLAPEAPALSWINELAARLGKQPWQLTESEVARAVPSTTGFDVEALHYKKHPLGGRTYAVPESGVVTLYHNTNVEPASFLADGIKPAEHDSIFAHQTPLPDPVHRFTVEFEAPITGPDATMHPSGGRLTGVDAYANPALNTYRTDFDYYGVWTGRRTVPVENIKRIRDNFTGEMVYDRDLGGGVAGTVSARYPNPPDRGATPFVYRDVHRDIVEQALREGKPVPPDVLADMPELAEKYPAPTPEAIVPQEAAQAQGGASAGLAPDIGATPAATRDLPAGTLPAPPATNYRTALADYTDRLYHETDPEGASFLLEGQVSRPEMFYSNTPDLALGQGGRGVLLELDPAGIAGQINKKPGWRVSWESAGGAEFRDRLPSGPAIRDNIRSVTIQPGLRARDPYLTRMQRLLSREGWQPATLDDGATRYTRPSAPATGGGDVAAGGQVAPASREAGLAALSGRDTNTLLSVAYDHPNAVANAQRKYADVGALRARAIERIQADRGRVARLAAADPDLAARVAALPDAEAAGEVRKATQLSAPGGDVAAGGGGGMMVVTPLAAARTLGPGAAEGAGRALSNLGMTGGDIGAAFGAGRTALREAGQAEAQGVSTAAQAEAAGLGHYVSAPRGVGQAVRDFLNQTRSVIVATPKNQLLDVLHTRAMAREFSPTGSDPAGTLDRIADELRANEAAPDAYGRLSDTLRAAQERWGFKGYVPDLGQGQVGALAQEEPGRVLPATQRVINGMVMELRTKGPVGLLTFPVGGARGYFQPGIDAFFQRINRAPQRGGREGLYTLTGDANSWLAAHTFLGDLARRGVDVTPLAGQAFTPEQVEAVAGTQAANEWRSLLATVWGGAEAETKRVLGDFGKRTALEKVPLIGRMFWLAGWSQRMLPVYAQVAARHPGVSMAVGGALANQAQGLKAEGLPPWAAGGVDTPIGRVNLLSPMPFSGELAGEALSALGGQEGEPQTGYQKFEGIAGGLGLPVNPLLGTAAYVAGLTPRRPGDLDRYAGVENALIGKGLGAIGLPSPTLQDVGGQGADYGHLIDRAREIVTGLEAGDLKAGKKAPASEADKEFARLVYERTGLPLADPRNIGAVIDSLADDPDTLAARWRKEAEANVAGRQGKQGVVSAVSPLTVSRIDPLQRAAAIGRQDQPYTYQQISAAYDSGNRKAAALMQQLNTASKAPNQRVYDAASESQRAGLVKGFLDQQQAVRRVPVSGDPYGLHNRPHGAGLP